MPARRTSPAPSEADVDIGAALFGRANKDELADDALLETYNYDNAGVTLGTSLSVMEDESGQDDEAIIAKQQAASNRKSSNLKGRTVRKGGGFQTMGLNANLLKAITRKGFSVPTPIQRKTIPLLLNEKDVVGMARTGSGKTAAFLIPMIEKLKTHSSQVGARALVLSPSRELALQTLQVCKELTKGTDLKSILLVGGDSLEEQFSVMSSNPDIVIATPGRFVHLKVEMGLDLSSVRYAVFDEADRLFEMGFADQLTEILHSLPPARQTLLFSATLPKSLVEFARAGLRDPILVRLDTESKVSPDLQSAFFTVRSSEKEGALLHLLEDVIRVPSSSNLDSSKDGEEQKPERGKKRKREHAGGQESKEATNPHSTIVFAATKHHVEYLSRLLTKAGYSVSHVYGSLDQTARKMQVQAFRTGRTNILVVTDVAARGIDIPVLANVVNYDFPSQPKIFVHRVGRTARAGQKGWSYSIIHDADAPYLLDLQLFLTRKLVVGRSEAIQADFAKDIVVGSLQRDDMQTSCEWVSRTLEDDVDIYTLRTVATKGEKLYQRTRNSASAESAKRAKALVASSKWSELHPLFDTEANNLEAEREKMLARIGGFRPDESIFEIGARRGGRKNNEEAVDAIRKIRNGLEKKKQKSHQQEQPAQDTAEYYGVSSKGQVNGLVEEEDEDEAIVQNPDALDMSEASDSEIEVTFSNHQPSKQTRSKHDRNVHSSKLSFRDSENFMSYTPTSTNLSEDRAYGVHAGSNGNFTEAARNATMDLAGDETGGKTFGETRQIMRWDKRHKKYVRRSNDEDGSHGGNSRLVRSESGAKIAASFKSGRYDAWRRANRITRVPRVGEAESNTGNYSTGGANRRFRHNKTQQAKLPDKFRDDYDKKSKKLREAKAQAAEAGGEWNSTSGKGGGGGAGVAVAKGGKGKITNTVDDIHKQRRLKQKRREKNARPSRKGRK